MSNDKPEPKKTDLKKKDTTVVETQMLEDLCNYFASRLTHPHGKDVYIEKRVKHDDGTITKTRKIGEHIHLSNMTPSFDHDWYHKLAKILGKHEYKVVAEQ